LIGGFLFFTATEKNPGTYAGTTDLCANLDPIYDYNNNGDGFSLNEYTLSELCTEGAIAYTGGEYLASGHKRTWYCVNEEGAFEQCFVQELRCGDGVCQ